VVRNVPLDDVDAIDRAVLAIGTDYPRRHLLEFHRHRRAQLLYGATGIMRVDTADATWTVPTQRAVLIPSNTDHQVLMEGVSTRSLYIEPAAAPWFPARCQVVDISPLLRALLLAAVDLPAAY
jgi:mannose-6-phosphate isomerase-like protein (cupin superfamily)